jgi:CelD/BcsL family acetyltransferase involved in cellulose biosynthesis
MRILDRIGLRAFIAERHELFTAAAARNPFAGPEWMDAFLAHVATDEWQFVVGEHADTGSVMLLYRSRAGDRRLAAVTNYYASLYSPVVSRELDQAVATAALVRQLDDIAPSPVAVTMAPIENDCADLLESAACFDRRTWYLKRYFCFGNWYMPSTGLSFARYMDERPGKLRNTWTRKLRKFERGGGRLELATQPADVGAAMDAYWRVYARSWKVPEPYADFVTAWAHTCAANGWLRLAVAWWENEPIAAQFWFTVNQRACIFKLAYDEAHTAISAGTLLTAFLMERSLDTDKVAEIDYLTGDDAYKRDWMARRRTREGILACNLRTPEGAVLAAREWAGELRRRILRRPADPLASSQPTGA